MSDPAVGRATRLRGPNVWVGLDQFGSSIVTDLAAECDALGRDHEVTRCNRFILLQPDAETNALARAATPATLEAHVRAAVGDLLSSDQAILASSEGEFNVPALWLVMDADHEDLESALSPVSRALRDLERLAISPRVYLLVRNIKWDRTRDMEPRSAGNVASIESHFLRIGSPVRGRAVVFVVSDFDQNNARFRSRDVDQVARNFAEFVLLTDAPRLPGNDADLVFSPRANRDPLDLNPYSAYCAIGAYRIEYPAQQRYEEIIRSRRDRFAGELAAVPTGNPHEFPLPVLERAEVNPALSWMPLDLPQWYVPLLAWDPQELYRSTMSVLDDWFGRSEYWRNHELVTTIQIRDELLLDTSDTVATYELNLDKGVREVLAADAVRGYSKAIRTFLDRCLAQMKLNRADLNTRPEEALPLSDDEILAMTPSARSQLEAEFATLRRMITNRSNPLLLFLVGGLTSLITVSWLLHLANRIDGNAVFESFANANNWINQHLGQTYDPFPQYGFIGSALTWLSSFAESIATHLLSPADRLVHWFMSLQDSIVFALVLATIGYCLGVVLFALYRDRYNLARMLSRMRNQAKQWRDRSLQERQSLIDQLGDWRHRQSLYVVEDMLQERLEVDRALDQYLTIAAMGQPGPESDDPPAEKSPFELTIEPQAVPQPLSENDVHHIMLRFRRGPGSTMWREAAPEEIIDTVLQDAARFANDVPPSIANEAAPISDRLRGVIELGDRLVLARPRPDGLAAPAWHFQPMLAVPTVLADRINGESFACPVLPLPVKDRCYAVAIRAHMTAPSLFS